MFVFGGEVLAEAQPLGLELVRCILGASLDVVSHRSGDDRSAFVVLPRWSYTMANINGRERVCNGWITQWVDNKADVHLAILPGVAQGVSQSFLR